MPAQLAFNYTDAGGGIFLKIQNQKRGLYVLPQMNFCHKVLNIILTVDDICAKQMRKNIGKIRKICTNFCLNTADYIWCIVTLDQDISDNTQMFGLSNQ